MLKNSKLATLSAIWGMIFVLPLSCGGSSDSDGTVADGTGIGGAGTGGGPGSGGSASGGSGVGGSASGGSGTGGKESCTNIECFRPYECVKECGSEEVINNGCCPCPEGMVDVLSCPAWTVTQGIRGEVLWVEGNQMPGADSSTGVIKPVSREVHIYEPVSESDAVEATDRKDAYAVYSKIETTLVATTTSNESGLFEVALEPGSYSVFVEDEGDWFCNSMTAEGLCVVTVLADEATSYAIRIDYAASY